MISKFLGPSDFQRAETAFAEHRYAAAFDAYLVIEKDAGEHSNMAKQRMEQIRNEARPALTEEFEKSMQSNNLEAALKSWQGLKTIYPEERDTAQLGERLRLAQLAEKEVRQRKSETDATEKKAKEDLERQTRLADERKAREYVDLVDVSQLFHKTDFQDSLELTSVQHRNNDKYREEQVAAINHKWIRRWQLRVSDVFDDRICFNHPSIAQLTLSACYIEITYRDSGLESATIARLRKLSKGQWVTVGFGKLRHEMASWYLEPVEELEF
ncbi:MAG: hypothetical protein JNM27_11310 [Leptospirales bacterium]|nr:hypothetical protein [Leptospirales bacterium]